MTRDIFAVRNGDQRVGDYTVPGTPYTVRVAAHGLSELARLSVLRDGVEDPLATRRAHAFLRFRPMTATTMRELGDFLALEPQGVA